MWIDYICEECGFQSRAEFWLMIAKVALAAPLCYVCFIGLLMVL